MTLPPEDGHEPDAFEREFLDDTFLPDPAKARDHLKSHQDALSKAARWHRGLDLTPENLRDRLDRLDIPMRRSMCMRSRFEKRWPVGLVDIERFPQLGN